MGKPVTGLNEPNETRYFYPYDNKWEMRNIAMKWSTVMSEGAAIGIEIVSSDVTGNKTLMWVENANGADFFGILAEGIRATDDDYATDGKLKGVWVPVTREARARFAVVGWTFTAADEGKTVQFAATSLWLDVDTKGKGARIQKYISATEGVCSFDLPNTETA